VLRVYLVYQVLYGAPLIFCAYALMGRGKPKAPWLRKEEEQGNTAVEEDAERHERNNAFLQTTISHQGIQCIEKR
jgi:hypothetical protein